MGNKANVNRKLTRKPRKPQKNHVAAGTKMQRAATKGALTRKKCGIAGEAVLQIARDAHLAYAAR